MRRNTSDFSVLNGLLELGEYFYREKISFNVYTDVETLASANYLVSCSNKVDLHRLYTTTT